MGNGNKLVINLDGADYILKDYVTQRMVTDVDGTFCPMCQSRSTNVVDIRYRETRKHRVRRRICTQCHYKWNTIEVLIPSESAKEKRIDKRWAIENPDEAE